MSQGGTEGPTLTPIASSPATPVFGRVLASFRDAYGLSQQDLADRSGISRPTIQRYEGGKSLPDRDALNTLARCVGMPDPVRQLALLTCGLAVDGPWADDLRRRLYQAVRSASSADADPPDPAA